MSDERKIVDWDTPENARLYRAYTEEHRMYRDMSDRLVALCDVHPGMTVLDLGCGTGATVDALYRAHADAARIVALDGSEAQLAIAREHAPSTSIEYLCSPAEELADVVEGPVHRVVSNAAFWQMKPRETLRQLSEIAAGDLRIVFNTFPTLAIENGQPVETTYDPSIPSPDDLIESRKQSPSLPDVMIEVARAEFGFTPDETLDETRAERRRRYMVELVEGLESCALEVVRQELFWFRHSPESDKGWYDIPIFRRNILPTMDAETSKRVLDAAYEKWRPTAVDVRSPMLNVVLARRAHGET